MRTPLIVGSLVMALSIGAGHTALSGDGVGSHWSGVKHQPVFWPGPPGPGPHPGPWPGPHPGPHPGTHVDVFVPLPILAPPPPRVIVEPVYVAPQPVYVAPAPQAVYASPTPASIRIVNPPTSTVVMSYTLNGQPYKIAPGQEQTLTQTYVIEFNRGGSAGIARYALSDGVYTFTPAANGAWELYHAPH